MCQIKEGNQPHERLCTCSPEKSPSWPFSLAPSIISLFLFLSDFIWITCLLLLTFSFRLVFTTFPLFKSGLSHSLSSSFLYIHLHMCPFTFSPGIPPHPTLHLFFSLFTCLHLFRVTFFFSLTLFNIFL